MSAAHPIPLSRLHALRAELQQKLEQAKAQLNGVAGGLLIVDQLIAESVQSPPPAVDAAPAGSSPNKPAP